MAMRSPDQMMVAAQTQMLDGQPPESQEDWCRIINFWAANIVLEPSINSAACRLMARIYGCDCLSDRQINEISAFQVEKGRSHEGTLASD